jgi:hypothetical protein
MKVLLLVIALAFSVGALAAADEPSIGIGAYPVSQTTVSMWLLYATAPKPLPILLVYFTGAPGWSDRPWQTQFDGDLKSQAQINYRLVSKDVTLYIALSADKKTAWVQGKKYDLSQGNVYLVGNADSGSKNEKIAVLGNFDLTNPSELPVSLYMLRQHPELAQKVK